MGTRNPTKNTKKMGGQGNAQPVKTGDSKFETTGPPAAAHQQTWTSGSSAGSINTAMPRHVNGSDPGEQYLTSYRAAFSRSGQSQENVSPSSYRITKVAHPCTEDHVSARCGPPKAMVSVPLATKITSENLNAAFGPGSASPLLEVGRCRLTLSQPVLKAKPPYFQRWGL
jgi:hypothetical protein